MRRNAEQHWFPVTQSDPLRCQKLGHLLRQYWRTEEAKLGIRCTRRGCYYKPDMTKPPFPQEPTTFCWPNEAKLLNAQNLAQRLSR